MFARKLHVNVTYYSWFMNIIIDTYLADLKNLNIETSINIKIIISMTKIYIQT